MLRDDIHLGNLIYNKLKDERRSVSWLAGQIHCKRNNIYKIFSKSSIDTDLLLRISLALKTDFSVYLSESYQDKMKKMENEKAKSKG